MRRVQANDFESGDWVDYSADGIRIINDIKRITRPDDKPVALDINIIVFCQQGSMDVTINNEKHVLKQRQVLFLQQNSVVNGYHFSENLQAKALVFSMSAVDNGIFMRRKIWDNIAYLHLQPIITPSESHWQLFSHYYSIALFNINETESLYKQEIVSHLLRSLIYEFLLMTDGMVSSKNDRQQSTADELYQHFLSLLGYSRGRMRKVQQYADQLCVTPDHLTAVVKHISGRTAIEWITESTVNAITHELLYTSRPIKEIADDLDFPSLSFFGKYYKQHTGFSPRERRNINTV